MAVIQRLKNRKSDGIDGIPAEALKILSDEGVDHIYANWAEV